MLNLRLSQRNESYHKKLMPSVSAFYYGHVTHIIFDSKKGGTII